MNLSKVRALAQGWLDKLAPYCERIEIKGSIARGKPEPKDIELVAIPKFGKGTTDLFGAEVAPVNLLNLIVDAHARNEDLVLTKNGDRYKQFHLPEYVYVDLFIVLPPAQWGVIATIRTGPGDYSKWLVTQKRQGGAMPAHLHQKDGALWRGNEMIETPEESDYFRALGLDWVAPELRCPPNRIPPNGKRILVGV